jgi:hypothetical protein
MTKPISSKRFSALFLPGGKGFLASDRKGVEEQEYQGEAGQSLKKPAALTSIAPGGRTEPI